MARRRPFGDRKRLAFREARMCPGCGGGMPAELELCETCEALRRGDLFGAGTTR